ncbi:Hypothetical transmembrane protein CDS_ID OB1773 [Staphylococcus aureus]|nr:Hypothetical transmembrane protein CDS_ID OB1773 [Staphylococcus aureus]
MTIKAFWQYTLYQRSWLMMLLICNILGMIYGYIWYGEQLSIRPGILRFLFQIAQLQYYT